MFQALLHWLHFFMLNPVNILFRFSDLVPARLSSSSDVSTSVIRLFISHLVKHLLVQFPRCEQNRINDRTGKDERRPDLAANRRRSEVRVTQASCFPQENFHNIILLLLHSPQLYLLLQPFQPVPNYLIYEPVF